MKRRYIQYDKLTEAFSRTPELDEQDLLEAPDHIIYFRTNEERDAFKRQLESVHPVKQVTFSSVDNINPKEETEVAIESKVEATEGIIEKQKHVNHGGKRTGSGRPKGFKLTEDTKDKIKKNMKGNQNATKDK